jgi:hypothetical protein
MGNSVIDYPALLLATALSLVVAGTLILAHRGENKRRAWIAAAALTVALGTLGGLDLMRESSRETHVATIILAATLPVLGAIGTIRGTRRVHQPWLRWPIVFAATFALLFAGLLIGATVLPRYFRS